MKKEEKALENLLFDIPCGECGEIIFTLPYIKGAIHTIPCHKCKETNLIEISKNGGIGHITSNKLEEKIKAIKEALENRLLDCDLECSIKNPSDDCRYSPPYFTGFEVKGLHLIYGIGCADKVRVSKRKVSLLSSTIEVYGI